MSEHHHKTTVTDEDVTLPENSPLGKIGLVLMVGGVAGAFALMALFDAEDFGFKYLTSFMFWLSIGLGGLIFVLIHHATRAGWSTVLRRLAENCMFAIPVLAVLFIPIVLTMSDHTFFEWTHQEALAEDVILQWKEPYLNTGSFIIRAVVVFSLWIGLAFAMYRFSTRHDEEGGEALIHKMRWLAPLGVLIFALSITVAAMDWMMSLDPHWFSTIFGVYYFAGTFIAINAMLILLSALMQSQGALKNVVTTDHYHDLGKYVFAFTIFWTYIAFSQYFLIWYANVPEETYWFAYRWELCPTDVCVAPGETSGWATVSLMLIFGHFVIPFFMLMSRHIKRRKATLIFGACWMLAVHWLDMFWLIQPVQDYLHHAHGEVGAGLEHAMHGPHPGVLDLLCFLTIGAGVIGTFLWRAKARKLVPVKDPRLADSLAFENFPT